MYDVNLEEVRAVIDKNSNPIYVDMNIFGIEIEKQAKLTSSISRKKNEYKEIKTVFD